MADKIVISVEFDADKKGLKDIEGLAKDIQTKFKDSFDSSSKSSDSFFSKLTKSIVPTIDLVNLAGKAFDFISTSIKESVGAAIEEEKALSKLNASLKLTGQNTEENISRFAEFADKIEKSTGLVGEAVLEQVSFAKSLGFSNVETEKIIKTATDLSTVLGISLDSAVEQLTKTYSGNAGRLSQLIPELKNLSQESLIAGGAVDLLSSKFGGSAIEAQNNFGGALAQLQIAFGDILKVIGKFITENKTLQSIITGTTKLIRSFLPKSEIDQLSSSIDNLNEKIAEEEKLIKQGIFGSKNRLKLFEDQKKAIEDQIATINKQQQSQDAIDKAQAERAAKDRIAGEEKRKANEELAKSLDSLKLKYENFSNSRIKQLENEKNKELKVAGSNTQLRLKIEENFNKQIAEIRQKDNEEFAKEAENRLKTIEETRKKQINAFSQGASNIFGNKEIEKDLETDVTAKVNFQLGQAGGFLQQITKGAEGARNLIVQGASKLVDTLVPGFGAVAGPILEAFSQGPEKVQEFVNGFIDAIPVIIQNLILSIPAFIDALVEGIPVLIDKLVQSLPIVFESLARLIPGLGIRLAAEAPRIAISFATAFIKEAPRIVTGIISGLADGLKDLVNKINPFSSSSSGGGIGGAISSAVKSVGKLFKFADGGQGFVKQVPSGFSNDSFPARLTSGELVVDRSTAFKLKDFLDSKPQEQTSGLAEGLLLQILNTLQENKQINTSVNINGRELAYSIVELRRQGYAV